MDRGLRFITPFLVAFSKHGSILAIAWDSSKKSPSWSASEGGTWSHHWLQPNSSKSDVQQEPSDSSPSAESQIRRDGLIQFAPDNTSQNRKDGIIEHIFKLLPSGGFASHCSRGSDLCCEHCGFLLIGPELWVLTFDSISCDARDRNYSSKLPSSIRRARPKRTFDSAVKWKNLLRRKSGGRTELPSLNGYFKRNQNSPSGLAQQVLLLSQL
jgi:hypothetical protein